MKTIKILVVIICLLFPMTAYGAETKDDVQVEIQEEIMDEFQYSEIDDILKDLFPNKKISFRETVSGLISGELDFSFDLVKELLWDSFAYELSNSKAGMIHILFLIIIAAIFTNFSEVFKSTQVSNICFTMLYMLIITICLNTFRTLVDSATSNVSQLSDFMGALGPIYFLAVAISTGSSTSVTFYQIVLILIYIVELLIANFLIPLSQIYLVVRILSEFSPEVKLSKFAELLETIVSWSLKTLLAGVIGLNVIQSLLSPAIDTVKRSILTKGGEALPFLGDAFGGVTEVILGTAVLIKNGVGVAGMVICILVCLAPIIKMAATTLLFQVVAALVQPISDKRMVDCISGMAQGTKMLLKIVFTTGVLFLLTIAVVATTTGG